MNHREAEELLPAYALGALDEPAELAEHLRTCRRCQALLADYLETTARLGEAVEPVAPPPRLRATVLANAPAARRSRPRFIPFGRPFLLAAALAALLAIAFLSAADLRQRQQLAADQGQLALDERGLALLTSTETSVERLNPVAALPPGAHGHWYHRDGVPTQVVVVEMLPPAPSGRFYLGWLRRDDGTWRRTGAFTLDSSGYGRVILLGDDGSHVVEVVVTRQSGESAEPAGETVLQWKRG